MNSSASTIEPSSDLVVLCSWNLLEVKLKTVLIHRWKPLIITSSVYVDTTAHTVVTGFNPLSEVVEELSDNDIDVAS